MSDYPYWLRQKIIIQRLSQENRELKRENALLYCELINSIVERVCDKYNLLVHVPDEALPPCESFGYQP